MSGSRTPTPDSNDTSNVVICLFIGRRLKDETFDRESQTLIIQLVPIYRVFGPGEGGRTMFDVEMHNDVTSLLDSARGGFSLWREHSHSATFRIDGRKGTLKVNRPYEGPLPWREDLEETLVKEEITLDKIKLFCFAP
jgi:hypothetical protein